MNNEHKQTSNQALLFIPDITGFTKFVNSTEINHAKHIIEELLEALIDSNEIGLELSEIEGDALLFYRHGKAPTAAELLAQVQRMYTNFHGHLKKYESHRICNCGACTTANELSLKFVAHYGEIANKQVKDRNKLFGKDVIVAHRLLKNDINLGEYSLFSDTLVKACSTWLQLPQVAWSEVNHLKESYDFGEAKYCFIELEPLQEHVPEPQLEDFSIPGLTMPVMEVEYLIEAPIDLVFDVASDLSFRHKWLVGLIDSDKLNHKVPQVGSTHRCVIKGDKSDPFHVSHSYEFQQNKVTFMESDHRANSSSLTELKAIGKGITRVRLVVFVKPNRLVKWIFDLFMKKKNVESMRQSYSNLNDYCKELLAKDKPHSNQIVLPSFEGIAA